MKIPDIIESLNPSDGGPQHSVRALSRIWREMGHTVDILALDSPRAPYLNPELGVIAIGRRGAPQTGQRAKVQKLFLRDLPGAIFKTSKIVKNYDVVLVHGLWNHATLLARCVLTRQKVPYFVFIHGMLDPWHKEAYPIKDLVKRALWPFNESVLLKNADAAFFTTQMEINLAERGYWPYKLNAELIKYGCRGPDNSQTDEHHAAFCKQLPALRDQKFLLFMSRIHPKKGCETLLRAFAACQDDAPDLHLVMAGPDQIGWRPDLEKLSHDLGIAGKVHWVGPISGPIKWAAMKACEAFILPSHGKNFGIVVAEAMACAIPVLISDKVNLCDTVAAHHAGIVAPHDLDGTISLIRKFTRLNVDERTEMAQNGLQCYHLLYEIEAAATGMIELLTAHIERSPRPRPNTAALVPDLIG